MGLFSIFRRTDPTTRAPAAADSGDAVQQARIRARRRLIGAAVLLVIGVIGFPLVFETRPRPIPVDIPIEIPKKDGAPALVMPAARTPNVAPVAGVRSAPAPAEDIITEASTDAGREVTAPKPASAAAAKAADAKVATKPADTRVATKSAEPRPTDAKVAAKPTEAKAAVKPTAEARTSEAKSAESKLAESKPAESKSAEAKPTEAKGASSAESARFVVQVGAFAEAGSAREARTKVEKLGLKTYTQVAETPGGSRIRVRVGPFGSRAEADAALAKARAAGLAAVVLTL